jgi:hypothetical protein
MPSPANAVSFASMCNHSENARVCSGVSCFNNFSRIIAFGERLRWWLWLRARVRLWSAIASLRRVSRAAGLVAIGRVGSP